MSLFDVNTSTSSVFVQHFTAVYPPQTPSIWSRILERFNLENATQYKLEHVTFGHPQDLNRTTHDFLKRRLYRTQVDLKIGSAKETRPLTYNRLSLEDYYPNPPKLKYRPNREDYGIQISEILNPYYDPAYYEISLARNDQNESFVKLTALATNPVFVGQLYFTLEETQNG